MEELTSAKPTCKFTMTNGSACKRPVRKEGYRCWQHARGFRQSWNALTGNKSVNFVAALLGLALTVIGLYFGYDAWQRERHDSPPSFVFVCCSLLVTYNSLDSWDFIVKHRGDKAVESIDLYFVDVDRLESIRKNTPPNTPINPDQYSRFLHIDKMYPKGLESLFAKQFIWSPDTREHGHYSVDISGSTGRFHEDLFIEKTEGKNMYASAARVEEIDTKRPLLICRDRSFPKSVAPTIVTDQDCFPDWIAH